MGMNACVLGIALLSAGAAEHPHGLYVKLSGLWVDQESSDLSSSGGVPLVTTLEFDSGYGVMGGIGYTLSLDLPVAISVEVEYAFRSADVDSFTGPLVLPALGTYDSHSVMANAIASVDIANGFGLYGGIGVGATATTADLAVDLGLGVIDVPTEDDFTFSWQVLGGVQYAIGNHLLIFGGVRYFDAGEVDLDAFDADNASFAVEAGLRVYF